MRILLDHNLDRRLAQYLDGFEVSTTQREGWADALNGELLRLAEDAGFDVMVSGDGNLKLQQNMSGRRISVVVLRALNNRLATHLEMLDKLVITLGEIGPGEIEEVIHNDFPTK